MTLYQAERILQTSLNTLGEPLRSAVKFALSHWEKLTGHKKTFEYPANWFLLKNLPNEEWRDVQGHEGIYQISSFGRVKSLHKKGFARILKPSFTQHGYLRVNLSKDGGSQNCMVHFLVATAFLEKPAGVEFVVNHKNNNHTDNRLVNLEWVTRSENTTHAYQIGALKKRRGAEVSLAKLTDDDVRVIRASYIPRDKIFGSYGLAKKYSVAPSTILRVVHRESYTNVE